MADAGTPHPPAATLAVVVSAGVSPYLFRTLRGLAAQTLAPGTVLVIDTSAPGRSVGTGVPVADAVSDAGLDDVTTVRIVRAPGARTFGEAVRSALTEHAEHTAKVLHRRDREATVPPPPPWLWLLHDDSEPAPDALAELVRAAESGPSIAIAGAKQRDWSRPDHLLEVGLSATSTARRVLDIEAGEIDQGQHDGREDVLAVGTAGALVRRAVWDDLEGTDPALGPFGDGLDLSRRARLAGHRVVVVPSAVVHHARASYLGLRADSSPRAEAPERPDPRRSFAARRHAQLHNWMVSAPGPLLPLIALAVLVLAPLRALWRVATKELGLVGAEMRAAAEVLARPGAILAARRRARSTRTLSRRHLRPLQSTWRDVARGKKDARRARAAARTTREAPSELELNERAQLRRRRRGTLGAVALGLLVLALVAFAPLLTAGPLTGGALVPSDAGLRGLWSAAITGWVPSGLGHAGPADPLLLVLAVPMLVLAPFGGSVNVLVTALVVLAVPLAGIGAWFAAGAATRSVLLRAWAAVVWALAPALLLGVGQGRLGAVLAHLAVPWVALGVARAVGVNRVDTILSGMVGAQRVAPADLAPERPTAEQAAEAEKLDDRPSEHARVHAPEAAAVRGAGAAVHAPRVGAVHAPEAAAVHAPGDAAMHAPEAAAVHAPGDAAVRVSGPTADPALAVPSPAVPTTSERAAAVDATPATALEPAPEPEPEPEPGSGAAPEPAVAVEHDAPHEGQTMPVKPAGAAASAPRTRPASVPAAAEVAPPRAHRSAAGSLAAAAGAGLALAVATAGAPVLLPASLVVLVLLAVVAPRRRHLLVIVALPPLVLLGPLLTAALSDVDAGSWRILLADPGAPYASEAGPAWFPLLGWPVPTPGVPGLDEPWSTWLPLAGGAVLVVLAVVALLRGTGRARAVRAGWVVVLVGLVAALASARTDVAVGADSAGVAQLVRGWAGGGTSLVVLGLLVATVAAGDGLRASLSSRSFGWRQLTAGILTVAMVLAPLVVAAGWVMSVTAERERPTAVLAVHGRENPPVPALAEELQNGSERSRVLALGTDGEQITAEIWRGPGPQLTGTSTVVAARALTGVPGRTRLVQPDAATTEVDQLVAELAGGTATGTGRRLGELGIGVVLVPPVSAYETDGEAPVSVRDDLVARLDSTAGLERVTENDSGVIWRVSRSADQPGAADAVSRARVVDADGAVLQPLAAGASDVTARVPQGPEGRTVVLAERADEGWHATYNGRALRATTDGWRQAFELPAHTGELSVSYEPAWRMPWLLIQVVVLGLVVLLALPVQRRREGF
ncbi:glycosyltransferase [Georgenia wangjunii]|uniref:glycosyltransferase n=1 Tax=Georgenia wangjunii TaxID=3117730 RepID=UPI002F2680A6